MTRRPSSSSREYPRTARLNQLLREIVAEEMERIDDDRLGLMTIVAVEVDNELHQANVWYTSLADGVAAEEDEVLVEALEDHRRQVQQAIARQARIKRTPTVVFKPDPVTREAARLEAIMRDIAPTEPG